MGLFDILDGTIMKGPFDPKEKNPLFREEKRIIRDKFRKKVDEFISPYSDAGEAIHKVRRFVDREEEKAENRENAAKNLFYTGEKKESFELADHLFIRVGVITHHAIYIGGNEVIHYSSRPDGRIEIRKASLEEFSEGRKIYCLNEKESPLKYSKWEAVHRACVRLEEHSYDLMGNNCEHFVRWCRNGGKEYVWED